MPYVVFGENKQAPTKHHDSIDSACAEAIRLSNTPRGRGYKFYVAQIVEQHFSAATPADLAIQERARIDRRKQQQQQKQKRQQPKPQQPKQQPKPAAGGRGLSARFAK